MPSTPAQFFGYGYGPGHHAPMVRMPCCTPMSVQRLEFVPCHACQGNCQGTCGMGCAGQRGYCDAARQYNAPQQFYSPQPAYNAAPILQPVHNCPCNASNDLFMAPSMQMVPKPEMAAPVGSNTALPSPAAEPVSTPGN